jgi:hypothetical protein
MSTSAPPTETDADRGPVTRDDLEAKFRELFTGARDEAASAKGTLVSVGVVIGLILLLVVFLLGRRGGKKRTTVVEIRRV